MSDLVFEAIRKCPDYIDFGAAWAIQKDRGETLQHHEKCSSVPGWHALSGPHFLCDCGAVEKEWARIRPEALTTP